jgi:hypothetical protein
LLGTVPGDVELVAVSFDGVSVDRVRFDQAGVPAENSTFAVPNTTFQVDFPGGLPLRNVTAIHVTKTDSDADSGTMTLHYRSASQQLAQAVPLDLAAGTSMQKVAFLAADPSNRKAELMAHLQANRAYYSQAVVGNLDSATLVMLLSRFTWRGKPLADQVEPNPLAVAGNFLVLRAPIEDDEAAGIDDNGTPWGELLRQRELTFEQRDDRLVPIPTGGVFAEAVLGRSNSAEKLDITRFWNWQDSPIPLQPSEIAPVSTGSRATAEGLEPGQLGAPVLNILNPTALPEPAGLTAALNTLASASLFRDMSGLAGTQALAQAGSAGTLSAATEAGRLASANLKTVTDQAVAMGQAAADMWKTLQAKGDRGGGSGSGSGGLGSNVSADGARINHGRDMDQRGVSDAGGGGFKVTELQSEFQAAGGSGSSGGGIGGGNAPVSRELAFADSAATGVSPALLAGTTTALSGGVAAANLAGASVVSSFVMLAVETLILGQIRVDVEASGISLQGVSLHRMREHPHGELFRAIGLPGWTNSGTDIFIDTDACFDNLVNLQKGGKSIDDSVQFMRGFATVVVRHEAIHLEQFRRTGKPATFKQMLDYELEAYGCNSATATATSSLTWLNQQGQGGARDFLVNKLVMAPAAADDLIQDFRRQIVENCRVLNSFGPSESEIKTGLTTKEFLPRELGKQGSNYEVGDLYKP